MALKKKILKKGKDASKRKHAANAGPDGKDKYTPFKNKRKLDRVDEDAEIRSLEARIKTEAPRAGHGAFAPVEKAKGSESAESGPTLTTRLFKDLPLSQRTLKALSQNHFTKMTEIQHGAIPHALAGRDVLGEARTGSGKTLAFLVPLIELLFRSRWTRLDGLGGLIVSPTRELSYQIYRVLVEIGAEHDLSAGCVVGGRDFREEQQMAIGMNIIVSTPGRLLQHLDESPGFDAGNVQMLALDEADRILDFGFQETVHHILNHLTQDRQTMLFSATLHTSVHRLSKVALRSPEIVSVHKDAKSRTPDKLKQVYMVVPLEQKLDVLFSFLRSHSQKKIIVFVSACKQVRFLYESFRQLKPGPAIMELHGRQSLTKRMLTFKEFSERERAVALFCTDIAARGVDFPVVDWVLQVDCPDTVDSYVHRVGRTARYESGGNSALLLLPSETAFIPKLKAQRIDPRSISAKQGKVQAIQAKIQAVIAGDPAIKHLAQKAMISYVRSIHLTKDKEVFKVQELPLENFAESLGLAGVPEGLGELAEGADGEKNALKMKKNQSALQRLKDKIKAKKAAAKTAEPAPVAEEDSESDDPQRPGKKKKLSRWERRQRRIEKMENMPEKERVEEEDDLLVPVTSQVEEPAVVLPPRKKKLRLGKDGVAVGAAGTHTYFADKGKAASSVFGAIAEDNDVEKSNSASDSKESRQAFLERVAVDLAERDGGDAAKSRARIRDMHQKSKRLAKNARRGDAEDGSDIDTGVGVQLSGASPESSGDEEMRQKRNARRSPSPPSSGDEYWRQKREGNVPTAPPKATASTKEDKRPAAVGKAISSSDDLGTLEQQVLSRLSGLF